MAEFANGFMTKGRSKSHYVIYCNNITVNIESNRKQLAEFAKRFMTRSRKKQTLIAQSMNQKIASVRVSSSGKKCTCLGFRV